MALIEEAVSWMDGANGASEHAFRKGAADDILCSC
jgi:hypothetical protein